MNGSTTVFFEASFTGTDHSQERKFWTINFIIIQKIEN